MSNQHSELAGDRKGALPQPSAGPDGFKDVPAQHSLRELLDRFNVMRRLGIDESDFLLWKQASVELDRLEEQQQSALETAHRWQEEAIDAGNELNALKELLEALCVAIDGADPRKHDFSYGGQARAWRHLRKVRGSNPASEPHDFLTKAEREAGDV